MEMQNIASADAIETRAHFTIEAAPFRAAVEFLAKRIVERRNTIPILSNIALHAGPDGLRIVGNNLDQTATLDLAADVDGFGSFTVDAAALADVLKKMAKGASVTMKDDGGRVRVSGGRVAVNMPTLPVDDFPTLAPPIDENGHRFTLSAQLETARAKISTMEGRMEGLSEELMEMTGRALRAETALAATTARINGWPPAVARVTFGRAA